MKSTGNTARQTKSRIKPSLGDVVAIPLEEHGFAYAVILRSETFAVLEVVTKQLLSLDEALNAKPSFYQAGVLDAVKDKRWPIIGRVTFDNEEDEWAPPRATWYIRETNEWTVGTPRVQLRGQAIPATLEEVKGMDIFSVCHTPELVIKVIIDRLINGNHDNYKVRPQ